MEDVDMVDSDSRRMRLVDILGEIPWRSWEGIVRDEPEWHNMERFLSKLNFGPFSVLMVITGLNDFQTKGTADKGYWPPIRQIMEMSPIPITPVEMEDQLLHFYENERLRTTKVNRLRRFLGSPLAERLWLDSSTKTSEDFVAIWEELAKTMRQRPEKKTICFAMKCLGLALLMDGEYDFDFSEIPIPADSRVTNFTKKARISDDSEEPTVRYVWSEVIEGLRRQDDRITMIHVDSLIWQIEPLGRHEIEAYFESLGIGSIGDKLRSFMGEARS